MAAPVIEINNISKRYSIGEKVSYGSLREEIMQALAAPFRRLGKTRDAGDETNVVWALKDVSFDVNEGDVVGIIGKNGSGKSTLLKILSRTTEPTEGRITMRGRVSSLLEVGTGFHPELTGRENIFLNGALLGMSNAEIRKNFDEIVDFSEIEKFLDTPVKRYSSGMYVRLAFAVAAHLNPEILIIDEVLAVGDMAFQQKCLGKMDDVARGGKTILIVSHSMTTVEKLCQKAIFLEKGRVADIGIVEKVTESYLDTDIPDTEEGIIQITKGPFHNKKIDFTIDKIEVTDPEGHALEKITTYDSIKIRVEYRAGQKVTVPALSIICKSRLEEKIFHLCSMPFSAYYIEDIKGKGFFEVIIENLPLVGGTYLLDIVFNNKPYAENYLWLTNVIRLEVEPIDLYNSGWKLDGKLGIIAVEHKWSHERL